MSGTTSHKDKKIKKTKNPGPLPQRIYRMGVNELAQSRCRGLPSEPIETPQREGKGKSVSKINFEEIIR